MFKYLFNNKLVNFSQNQYLLYEGHNNKAYLIPNKQKRNANIYLNRYFISIIIPVIFTSFYQPTNELIFALCHLVPLFLVMIFDIFFRQTFLSQFTVTTKYDQKIFDQKYNQYSKDKKLTLVFLYSATIILLWMLPFTNKNFQGITHLIINFALTIVLSIRLWEIGKSINTNN